MSNMLSYPGNNPDGTPIVFTDLINDTSKTKLLVLFNDAVALKAQQYVKDIVSAHPEEYVSVIFLFVAEPYAVQDALKQLAVKLRIATHFLHWEQYTSYRIFSISPENKLISDAVTATELDAAYGSIRSAVLCAFANG